MKLLIFIQGSHAIVSTAEVPLLQGPCGASEAAGVVAVEGRSRRLQRRCVYLVVVPPLI